VAFAFRGNSVYAKVMVVLSKIYTRTGDAGTTALGSGDRVAKSHPRIHAYGTIDETNACVGLVRLHTTSPELAVLDAMLARVQNDLFDLGADLCVPQAPDESQGGRLRIEQSQVERLEREIDQLNRDLEPLRSFVLPGGHPAAAALHLARTVCRRAERLMVELAGAEPGGVSPPAMRYVNRLSDYLFVAARWANAKCGGDVLWVPGATRTDV
jgi:cob(I)alamin adenosyltransferase